MRQGVSAALSADPAHPRGPRKGAEALLRDLRQVLLQDHQVQLAVAVVI